MIECGYFDSWSSLGDNNIGKCENIQYLEEDYKLNKKEGVKNCSYCKKELGLDSCHNIR